MLNLVYRPIGQSVALSVANTAHGAVTISGWGNDQCNQSLMWNSGTTTVAIFMAPASIGAGAPAVPVDGTPQGAPGQMCIVLPPSMVEPIAVVTPQVPYSINAIGSAAGPSVVYVVPIGNQS